MKMATANVVLAGTLLAGLGGVVAGYEWGERSAGPESRHGGEVLCDEARLVAASDGYATYAPTVRTVGEVSLRYASTVAFLYSGPLSDPTTGNVINRTPRIITRPGISAVEVPVENKTIVQLAVAVSDFPISETLSSGVRVAYCPATRSATPHPS